MRSSNKLLISSIVLMAAGAVGLIVILVLGNLGAGISNFGTGQGYCFGEEDFGHMSRDFFRGGRSADLDLEKVEDLTVQYLEEYGLDGLEISEIMEFSKNYYIEVAEENTGTGALELLVDKSSGAIFPEYGPNMMWNLKYGMHSSIPLDQDSIEMTISGAEALEISARYLARSNAGESAGVEAEEFYGYYTIHTLDSNGEIAGMLSVNGFTGDVWYHDWHGTFIQMTEEHS